MSTKKRLKPEEYTVGWLCALAQTEQVAAIKMLDEQHQELPKHRRDYNTYTYGSVGSHNIVIACLPLSHPGTTSAARMAEFLPTSFPNMRLYLFVGVGGGIPRNPPDPDASQDVHLGDVVVGVDQTPGVAGVVQYDFIRDQGEAGREPLGILDKPNLELLTALGKLFSNYEMGDCNPHLHLARLTGLRSDFSHPPPGEDRFYRSTYKHANGAPNCDQCAIDELVVRNKRQPPKQELQKQTQMDPETSVPVFHQAQILSGNSVIKDANRRDELSRAYPHARCFEMEAAGVVDQTHCLVIRGIADYADSHKNQTWQPYAAGTAAAFARELLLTIQPSIITQLETISPTSELGADPQSGNPYWMVPKSTNTLFTGRTRILKKLYDTLGLRASSSKVEERQKRFVIFGEGGIGKSEVCLKFANIHRNLFWGIFWIDASSEAMAKQSFIDIGKMCEAKTEGFEQVMTWLANIRHSWLLIIDNADNVDMDYAPFFPSGNRGNIILTTRNKECLNHATVGADDLGYLEDEDAISLLFKASQIDESLHEDKKEAALKIVHTLGFHTLAIIQAGAFIKNGFCPLEEYPVLFKQQEEEILKYKPKQAQSTYGSVFATFEVSATHLESSHHESATAALALLQILGFLHFQDIPELMFLRARKEAFAIREHIGREEPLNEIYQLSGLQTSRLPPFMMQGNDTAMNPFQFRWREVINLLESYSIIKISGIGENSSFSMHPLAHTWTRVRHDLASQKEHWKVAGSVIALSMRGPNYDMFHEKLRSHVAAHLDRRLAHPILEYMAGMTELEKCQTYYHICYLVYYMRDALNLRYLLETFKEFNTWTDASGSSSLHVKLLPVYCLREEGEYDRAAEILEQLAETDFPNFADNIRVRTELAIVYRKLKQPQKAVDLLENLMGIDKQQCEPDDNILLSSKYELGCAYNKSKQYEKAATLLEQVSAMRKISLASTHRSRLASQHELATAYLSIEQYERAAKLFEEIHEIERTVRVAVDPDLLLTQSGLARAYIGMGSGHCGKAAELLEQVFKIEQRTLASDDPNILATQYWLARAYIGMGSDHCERAAELFKQVFKIEQRTLAPEDPSLLITQYLLAEAYISMGSGHCGKAAELFEQVFKIEQRTLAPEDPSLLITQYLLAIAYISMGSGHYGKAEEILGRVVEIEGRTLAPHDPDRLESQGLLEELKELIEAEKNEESTSVGGGLAGPSD